MTDKDQVYKIILSLAKLFQSRCYVCHKKCTEGKYFVIHHKIYKVNEKIYSDFKKNGRPDRLAYYQYLEPIVRKEPKRFALVCNKDHFATETLKRYKKDKLKRLLRLVNQSLSEIYTNYIANI